MGNYGKILEYAWSLDIIDTHEHLPNENDWAKNEQDVLQNWLSHYFSTDIVSAGFAEDEYNELMGNNDISVKERWKKLEPYWNAASNTGYGRALDRTARDIYGVEGINSNTIEELNRKYRENVEKSRNGSYSHYDKIFKEKSKISDALVILYGEEKFRKDKPFHNVPIISGLLRPNNQYAIADLGKKFNTKIHSLNDWVDACELQIKKWVENGAVALKCGSAYARTIHFKKTNYADAEKVFNSMFIYPSGSSFYPNDIGQTEEVEIMENYIMHAILSIVDEMGLVLQIHTGIQAGNCNFLPNSNPELLNNLFQEYKNVTFDIFHIGYPYQHTLGALAKMFPNVMINMCWAHIISPQASVDSLVEWLDVVPANKISAFGGDYCFIDGVYGHAAIARENIARALAIKIENNCFDLERAKEICKWLFVDNPKRIFKI